ncbi:MAG: sugar ABC transporter permease [Lachnospiraceae bacterium]|nr:sugar ABC transporter permease [Lachnospiraceae bacterium]MBQ8548343.1 sugar ABC transporter permease [Lachnospiraceae bacterium]
MKKQKSTADVVVPKKKVGFKTYMKKYWQLYVMLLFPLLYLGIFKYTPMSYIQIAFKKYKINKSIWEMPWADNFGFEYFIDAFSNPDFLDALRNTILLNLLDLVIGFSIPIIFALILNELVFKRFKRVVQTIAYMPHFLSWVIICGLALQMFAPSNGLVNMFLNNMGMETVHFLDEPIHWIFTYIFLGIWQSFGWNSIVYLAAIAGINPELYEAAEVDGAGRWRKIWHVTLPGIKSTIVILLIMNLGNILGSGFDRPFALQNNLVMDVAEVLSTFVYKNGILGLKFSLTTAIGFFQSIVCVFFLLLANWISRKMGERGIW